MTVVPAIATAADVLDRKPDGVFLSNGPGDPAATGRYAVPEIRKLVDSGLPLFGICLGHQMLGLALGARTRKMHQGHHGANHPVKDFDGKVEIVSMNHGFTVDRETLPAGVKETHVSLFDGSNCGIAVEGRRCSPCSIIPRLRPVRRIAITCSTASSRSCGSGAAAGRPAARAEHDRRRRTHGRDLALLLLLALAAAAQTSGAPPPDFTSPLARDHPLAGRI